jgi:hypothetical protein
VNGAASLCLSTCVQSPAPVVRLPNGQLLPVRAALARMKRADAAEALHAAAAQLVGQAQAHAADGQGTSDSRGDLGVADAKGLSVLLAEVHLQRSTRTHGDDDEGGDGSTESRKSLLVGASPRVDARGVSNRASQ